MKKVVTALGIRHGPTHGEVKWFNGEPCLVEVGARCHGAEGLWVPVEDAVYNYNQVDLTCSSYLNPPQWELLPVAPSTRYGYGNMLFIVSYQSGTIDYIVKEILDEIRNFASYRGMEMFVKEGKQAFIYF